MTPARLYSLTQEAWEARVEKALAEGYFVRDEGAEIVRGGTMVTAQKVAGGHTVSVHVNFANPDGSTVTHVEVTPTRVQQRYFLTFDEAAVLARLVNLAGRSAEFIDRTFKNLRVHNATVVSADQGSLDATLAATGRPVSAPVLLVKKWGACPVCGKLITPRRTMVESVGIYRPEWLPRYCDHGPFSFMMGGVLGCLPEVGQPATVQVGSDLYAARVSHVGSSGKTIMVEREGREPEKATWREEQHAFCIVRTRGNWVTIGEATNHRSPEV